MKQKSIFFAIVFFFTLAFNGYSQSNLAKYVPADATFVVVINPDNLNSKVKLEDLGETVYFPNVESSTFQQHGRRRNARTHTGCT